MSASQLKVMNVMLSRQLGGIEQAFLNYDHALKKNHCDILNIVSTQAKIASYLPSDSKILSILNLNRYDIFSIFHLKMIISRYQPHAIIAHGNRSMQMCYYAKNSQIPLIGIAHNYNIKLLRKCDHIIALTTHLQKHLLQSNLSEDIITLIPNMIEIEDHNIIERRKPIIIGAMGRFVLKKGFDIFLKTIAILKNRKVEFKAIIAGNGEEKSALLNICRELKIDDIVSFIGWVENKQTFFDAIDIFCLPSIHEPFGIILLEAMMYKKPIVSFATEGPSEIINHEENGLLCEIGSDQALAHNLNILISDDKYAQKLATNAYLRVKQNYAIDTVGNKLHQALEKIYHDFQVNNSR
jgi:glycosyltransferase involved in cell wall biosynthesis